MSVTASWSELSGGIALLVHGGTVAVPEARRAVHEAGCRRAAERGAEVLRGGGTALDAVEVAVIALEDDPCFNAGTGACLTADGTLELDAAIMDGEHLHAGAVCALPAFANPIRIARAVLSDGHHVLYAAEGARAFAERAGFVAADPASMITERAREKLAAALAAGEAKSWAGGTVGAVARDARGHVAAATSTGGMAGKRAGRVGDSPILGAGTYADDGAGAASATGHGEGILRVTLASHCIAALAAGADPERAACDGMTMMQQRVGHTGGIILVDRDGRLGFARSTSTMSWAAFSARGVVSGT